MLDLRTTALCSAKNTLVSKSDRTEFLKNYELCVPLILIPPLITPKTQSTLSISLRAADMFGHLARWIY